MFLKEKKEIFYLNDFIKKELDEKGFSVYDYISLDELILTTRKDFLYILDKINVVLLVIVSILGVISYYTSMYFILPIFLFGVFLLIFIYIFIKLLFRTKLFLYISDVVFTKKGLMLSDEFYYYHKDEENIKEKLKKYEEIFLEYLGKPSKLRELILEKKEKILSSSFDTIGNIISKIIGRIGNFGNEKNLGGAIILSIVVFLSSALYIFSLYVFYYLGYFILYIFGFIYSFLLKIIIFLRNKKELEIKQKVLDIDENLEKMKNIYLILKNKVEDFKSGEIFNLEKVIDDKFKNFYIKIRIVLKQRDELKRIINSSKYKDFIDFNYFHKFLKKEFNKPILDMISLISKYEKKIILELKKISKLKNNSSKEIFSKTLEQKEFILEKNLERLKTNKNNLKKSLL